jgi:Zn-dependent peptidase ImmA (M78 family)/transcriptional regulator with XRE-family HTH domain
MDMRVISANLKLLRNEKSLSQQKTAELAGISRAAYIAIENGESVPRVSTLQNIALALNVKIQDLFAPFNELQSVRFRAQKSFKKRRSILIDVSRWLRNYYELEKQLNDQNDYKFHDLAQELVKLSPGKERAIYAAEKARKLLGLCENESLRDIAGLLENAGIKVYSYKSTSDSFFGLSVGEADGGPAVVVNVSDRIAVERWIFSAVHELGHLLLHLDSFNSNKVEEDEGEEFEANYFASYFLMPEKAFRAEWDEAYGLPFFDRVIKVKKIFHVSYKTVLYRLNETEPFNVWAKFNVEYKKKKGKSIEYKSEPEAISSELFFQAPENSRRIEPESMSPSHFIEERLKKLIRVAVEQNLITLNRAAEILKLSTSEMREISTSWV